MPRATPFFQPTSPGIRAAEKELGFPENTAGFTSLFSMMSESQLNDPAFIEATLTQLISARVLNMIRAERGLPLEEEPEEVATATPRPIPGQTPLPTDPPQTFQSLANEVVERP